MSWNAKVFLKINSLIGRYKWLDALGRAGAEWAIVVMIGWYAASDFIVNMPNRRAVFWPLAFLAAVWALGWILSVVIGLVVKEPRPHVTFSDSKLLFSPLMSWKSFPSDHAMSAWLILFMALIFGLPGIPALLFLALFVSWGRVYAGVHYPFDIVGGAAVAGLVAMFGYYLLVVVL